MKLISEFVDHGLETYIVEAKEGGKKTHMIEGIFMQAEGKNRNGRVYPVGTLATEVKRYTNEFINKKRRIFRKKNIKRSAHWKNKEKNKALVFFHYQFKWK